MEQWLNDTLAEVEHFHIPSTGVATAATKAITRYGLDRIELTNAGIPNDEVDKLYRSLFVYSVGFYGMVREMGERCTERKFEIITNVWKAY